ncbi:MAG: hypothetical protein KDK91_09770 [Gammaproteobacteria bacterium]|nr:hypothetical protein [Gammaproteobacteria bacterium]
MNGVGFDANADCPCGSGSCFGDCCRPLLDEQRAARTALELMRSRYTAYVLMRRDHLLRTWHPSTRPRLIQMDAGSRWLGLRIVACEDGGENDASGTVQFVARYKVGGRAFRLAERSRFVREAGAWLYLDGRESASGGRTDRS